MIFSQYTDIRYNEKSAHKFRKTGRQIFQYLTAKDEGGTIQVLKEFAWNTFESTGSIDSYFFFKEIEERDKAAMQKDIAEQEAAISKGS